MPDIILIERCKNMRAGRRIIVISFILFVVVTALALWKGCDSHPVPDALVKLIEVILPCLAFIVSRTSSTKSD